RAPPLSSPAALGPAPAAARAARRRGGNRSRNCLATRRLSWECSKGGSTDQGKTPSRGASLRAPRVPEPAGLEDSPRGLLSYLCGSLFFLMIQSRKTHARASV